ncbi:hypothetical protein BASA60_005980 [Batrachochytrium salamandrivorans]|nr:hypothetical protein BASA60_005980 [Batrachochytrium salamandrivorans]
MWRITRRCVKVCRNRALHIVSIPTSNSYSSISSNSYSSISSSITSNITSNISSNINSNISSNINSNITSNIRHHPSSLLRATFDTPDLSLPYSHALPDLLPRRSTGLFGYQGLHLPSGFVDAAVNGIKHAQLLVDRVCAATTDLELQKTPKRLDTLSDILCCVVDTAELVRNVHPNKAFVQAANHAHTLLSNYLNQLNTHQGLYNALKRTLERSHIVAGMSVEEKRVANLLMMDFEKSGIHMDDNIRAEFVRINDRILELGQEFTLNSFPSEELVQFNDVHSSLLGVPVPLIDALCRASSRSRRVSSSASPGSNTRVMIPTSSEIAATILRTAHKEETRKRIYLGMNSASSQQISVLEEMLMQRADLARLLGKQSYGHICLIDKMAESPENVQSFLESLSKANRPLCDSEYNRLNDIKRVHTGKTDGINGWDRAYYTRYLTSSSTGTHPSTDPNSNQTLSKFRDASVQLESLSSYFSVGSTFQGMSDVFHRLYGVRLEPSAVLPGETWHPDVRKLEVVHETEGKLGTIYCDLFLRENGGGRKYESAAHFTVRCSRRIDNDFESYDASTNLMHNPDNEQVLSSMDGSGPKRYQLPIIVLVTSFQRPLPGKPGLLELHDIQTLFHEMGHAMHSMLAKTDFQHIAGTRVAMDFVEVPSILMELFAKSPEVLATFGQHYQTGEPVPLELLQTRCSHLSTLEAMETQQQLKMALLDQLYHSPLAMDKSSFNTTAILEKLQNSTFPIAFAPDTHWQIQFSHLFGYGASYYSYLWSRRWASRIYRKLFHGKPMDKWREGGEEFRQHILRWGGGRDPWIGLHHIGVIKEGEREGKAVGDTTDLY